MSNIVGNPFKPFVTKQINTRQEVLSTTLRDDAFLKYVSKTPWLRMASSIDIESPTKADKLGLPLGVEGAKQFVLQGGSLAVSREATNDDISYTSLGQKFGVATNNSIVNQNSYGFGGGDFGKTPMPGLTSVTVQDYNRGAIRKAKVDFTCTNLQQFEIINTLYMRVGYNVLIEWGHSVYLDNEGVIRPRIDFNTPAFTSFFEGKNTTTLLKNIIQEQENTDGNYDAFMGRVTNFNWKFTNGVYECSIIVLTQGDVMESLKVNTSFNITNSPKVNTVVLTNDELSAQIATINTTDATGTSVGSDGFTPAQRVQIDILAAIESGEIDLGFETDESKTDESKTDENATNKGTEPLTPAFIKERDSNIISNILYNNLIKLTTNETDNTNTIKSNGFTDFLKFADGNGSEYFYVSLGALLNIIESNNLLYDSSSKSPIINIDSNYTTNFCARFPEQVSTHWDKCYVPYKVFNAKRSKYADNLIINELLGSQNKRYDYKNYTGRLMCILINVNFVNSVLTGSTDESGDISVKDFLGGLLEGVQVSLGNINDFQIGYDYITNSLKIYDNSPLVCSQLVNKTKPEVTKFQSYGVQKDQAASFLLDINIESSLSSNIANMLAAGSQTNGNQIGENATAFSLWNQGLIDRVRKTNLDSQTFDNSRTDEIALSLQQQFLNNKDKIYNILRNINSKVSSTEDLRACSSINRDFAQYYLGEATKSTIGNTKMGLPGNFFIPFNLGLNMDGLSGMRLFDAFSITNEVLPSLYTDALQFIINGINHSITGAGWTTSLSSQTYTQFEATGNANEYPTQEVTTRGEADLIEEGDDYTPNADWLRQQIRLYNTQNPGRVFEREKNGLLELTSAGADITKEMAFATIMILKAFSTDIPRLSGVDASDMIIEFTSGNDIFHRDRKKDGKPQPSLHKSGQAVDVIVYSAKNGKSGRTAGLLYNKALTILRGFAKGENNEPPSTRFGFIDEYNILPGCNLKETNHFHLNIGSNGTCTRVQRKEAIGTKAPTRKFSEFPAEIYDSYITAYNLQQKALLDKKALEESSTS